MQDREKEKNGRNSSEATKPVDTLGNYLLEQLKYDSVDFPKGLDAIVEIASQLSPEKQFNFIKAIVIESRFSNLNTLEETFSAYHAAAKALKLAENAKKDTDEQVKNLKKAKAALPLQLKNKEEENGYLIYPDLKRYLLANLRKAKNVNWETHLKELLEPPKKYPNWKTINLYNSPLYQVIGSVPGNPAIPTKLDVEEAFKENKEMGYSLYAAGKSGGKNKPGEYGAEYIRCYLDSENRIKTQRSLTKQATDDGKPNYREVIAEILGSGIASYIGGYEVGATYLAVRPGGHWGTPEDIYLSSIYFDAPEMIHQASHTILPEYEGDNPKEVPKRTKGNYAGQDIDSSLFGDPDFRKGCRELWKDNKKENKIEKTSFSKGMMASIATGNYQNHAENVVLTDLPDPNQNDSTIRAFGIFDFGGAFRRKFKHLIFESGRRFERAVHPEDASGKKYSAAYLAAYPKEVLRSSEFFDGLDEVCAISKVGLDNYIDKRINYVVSAFGAETFVKEFAGKLNLDSRILNPKDVSADSLKKAIIETKRFLTNTITARLYSIRDYGFKGKAEKIEIDIKNGEDPTYDTSDLISEYPLSYLLDTEKEKRSTVCNEFKDGGSLNKFFVKQLKLDKMTDVRPSISLIINETVYMIDQCVIYITPPKQEKEEQEKENDKDKEKAEAIKKNIDELNALKDFLYNAVNGNHQFNLNTEDDRRIIIQALNEGFHQIRNAYEHQPFKAHFLDYLSRDYARDEKPLDDIALESIKENKKLLKKINIDELATGPSAELIAAAKNILKECNAVEAINIISAEHLELKNFKELEDETVKLSFTAFTQAFYKKTTELCFMEDKISPWIVEILGRDNLENLIQNKGKEVINLEIFTATNQLLQSALEKAANDTDNSASDKLAFNDFLASGAPLIHEYNQKISTYAEELKNLQQLSIKNYRNEATKNKISKATASFAHNMGNLMSNPIEYADKYLEEIPQEIKRLQTLSDNDRDSTNITHESLVSSIPLTTFNPSRIFQQKTPAASLYGTPNPKTQTSGLKKIHELQRKNHPAVNVEINQYHSQGNQTPISDLMRVDKSIDTVELFSQLAREHFPSLDPFNRVKETKELFLRITAKLEENHKLINESTLSEALETQLNKLPPPTTGSQRPNRHDIQELAATLVKNYQLNFEQLDPFLDPVDEIFVHQEFHYPSDLLIRMAYKQIQDYKKESGEAKPEIYINDAWDSHYVEALILVAHMEGCTTKNHSAWKDEQFKMLDLKKEKFADFFKPRYKSIVDLDDDKHPSKQPGIT